MGLRRLIPGLKKPEASEGAHGNSLVELAGQASALAHGLYKFVRTVKPGKASLELTEARTEIERLQEQLRRAEEERDTLKKALSYFAKDPK